LAPLHHSPEAVRFHSGFHKIRAIRDPVQRSRSIVSADILASRLQGQDVHRSSFFDVVRQELGWDPVAAGQPLPDEVQAIFT